MKLKILINSLIAMVLGTMSILTQAHEGHAPPGVVHEMHHMLWIVMALAISAVAVFLLNKYRKSKSKTPD